MSSLDKVSTLVKRQLPEFIQEDHPTFVEFLERYYEFLETPESPIYELKRFQDNYDVDEARETFLKYFKSKIFPSFPDQSELSTEKIIKAARDFYTKKGTPEAFAFIFRALYNVDLQVFFPKLQILKASDGKWILPQAFRLTLSAQNQSLDLNLLRKRKAYGSISRASCIIESINVTIDNNTNLEIIEIFVSNVNRSFQNGEYLEIQYTDVNGATQLFSEKIIGALSNVRINPSRRGTKYNSGDPVVINGGLDTQSLTQRKAQAVVGNVTTGSISSVSVLNGGYGFRINPNTYIDIFSANGYGANVIVSGVDATNSITLVNALDSILYKANTLLNAADFQFVNIGTSTITTVIRDALTFDSIDVYPITQITLNNQGDFFDVEPTLDVVSLYDSDYYTDNNFISVPSGSHTNYDNSNATIQLVGSSYSNRDDWYTGWRLVLESQFRKIISYTGATKTATLERAFERNITTSSILAKNLNLDSRPYIKGMGKIAYIDLLNGGTGYSPGDTVSFIGTGYGATASLTISGGIITGITLTNRGEGYVDPPSIFVNTSSGSGAVFDVKMIGDGETVTFDVVTSSIGQIKDIILLDRGSDYITTPNVSLKVYDIKISGISPSETILENDVIFQGVDIDTATFKATVDSYDTSTNIIRAFEYSGSLSIGQDIIAIKTGASNVVSQVESYFDGAKTYPYRYGDGKAKANAEFLSGLIKYNGFYLNTDGHLSSDKKLQDKEKYHNFSYSLISKQQYSNYGKTILDTVHPAGAKLLPVHEIINDLNATAMSSINLSSDILTSNTYTDTINIGYNSNAVIGTSEYFDVVANVGDLLAINYANTHRSFTKVITSIANNNYLNIESPCVIIGEGRANVTANVNTLTIRNNTNAVISYISANDQIQINVNNVVMLKTINSISGNVITLNSNTGITTTNGNLMYLIYPQLNVVNYNVVASRVLV